MHPRHLYAQSEKNAYTMRVSALFFALLAGSLASVDARRKLVMYWGCNNPYNAGHKSFVDAPLETYCTKGNYDMVNIAFIEIFRDSRDHNLPNLHLFKSHCNTTFNGTSPDPGVGLLHCPEIGKQIKTCQAAGVKVGISLGGGVGAYSLSSDAEGREFAHTLWNMFFEGKGEMRPFDSAVLDGIDLDIEGGAPTGYIAFLDEFSGLTKQSGNKKKGYYIGGAPQCTAITGIGFMVKLIEQGAQYFTHLWPQFYNNYCSYMTGYNGAGWQSFIAQKNPKIEWYTGIPAAPAGGGGFVPKSDLPALVKASKGFANWDGVMMWDASWDSFNGWYSDSVRAALDATEH